MSALDWAIVIGVNGVIIIWALLRSRDTKTSSDWFLAGRSLPWWIVGMSLYATAIDSTDIIVDAGASFKDGYKVLAINWIGVVGGWFLLANFIAPKMYRAGMYTNAEYLEHRFCPTLRAASVLVQLIYRTAIMGMIAQALFLTLTVVCGFGTNAAWGSVVAIAVLATIYTSLGGLRSVAVTDALQSIIMLAASITIFWILWTEVGGWSGMQTRLDSHEAGLGDSVLQLGGSNKSLLLLASYAIAGIAYSVVNHTQSMRLLGARSESDMKLSVVLGGGILVAVSFMNLSAGVIGRCFYPELSGLPVDESLQTADAIFPVLVRDLAPWGLKGIVVAGLLAAAFSTYDSIGSTLSALVTRDVYARLLVKDRDDRHYMRFGQWITPVIILSSFAYLPFLQEKGMIFFYLDIVGAFVVPLLAVYLIGVFTRASPRSGSTALSVGVAYGVFTLTVDSPPAWLGGGSATSIVSLCLTSLTMLVITAFAGSWNGEGGQRDASGWLGRSAAEVEVSSEVQEDKRPLVFGLGLLSVIVVLCVWLW